jgi:hypothetical protein
MEKFILSAFVLGFAAFGLALSNGMLWASTALAAPSNYAGLVLYPPTRFTWPDAGTGGTQNGAVLLLDGGNVPTQSFPITTPVNTNSFAIQCTAFNDGGISGVGNFSVVGSNDGVSWYPFFFADGGAAQLSLPAGATGGTSALDPFYTNAAYLAMQFVDGGVPGGSGAAQCIINQLSH